MIRKPITRDKDRQLVFVSKPENDFEEVFAIFDEPVLVGIKMGGTNAHDVGAVNLRAKLQLGFSGIDFGGGGPVVMGLTVLVDQARNFGLQSHGTRAD